MSDERCAHVLDSNFFITPYRNYYSPDIAPSYWNQLKTKIQEASNIYTVDKVRDEICENKDFLSDWFRKSFPPDRIISTSEIISPYYEQVIQWAESKDFRSTALNEFKDQDNADAFVVAAALFVRDVRGFEPIIITDESYDPRAKKRVLIPVVCKAFAIRWNGILPFIRELAIKL